VVELKY